MAQSTKKFTPSKFEILKTGSKVGSRVSSIDKRSRGRKLNDCTGCESYHSNSIVGSCHDTCKEADTCPIWHRQKE